MFEFDCPAGLAFDSKFEVCVWPGSLSYSSPCSGSSEIAPVPKQRFICPGEPGYYADPENCRWFFACLDHGKSPLSAYEFRCPFGLVFDEERLVCEWPWLVPKCGSAGVVLTQTQEFVYGNGVTSLDQYDGLGQLGVVKLGGLAGGFVQAPAKVYTSAGQVILDHSNIAGIEAARLGVSEGIAKAQEDARIINDGLFGRISASVRPATGTVNIIGGGASVVGVVESASNADIQISHDGSSRYDSLAAFPASVEPVPVVASVPFPTLNGTGFETINGGVIANVPEFQYKFKSPSNIFFETNVGSNLENETLFVNYVSSTPAPFVKVGERYEYANTAIPFVQNSGAKITVVSSTPATTYVESSEGFVPQPVVPIGPIVSSYNYRAGQSKEEAISSVSYSGAISSGHQEQQPILEFGQKLNIPVVQFSYKGVGASANSAGAAGYQYQEQQVVGGVEEKVPIQQKFEFVTQPPISQYQQVDKAAGYQQIVNQPAVEQNKQFITPVVQYNYQSGGVRQNGYQYRQEQQVVPAPVVQYNYQNAAKANSYQFQQDFRASVNNKVNFGSGGSYEYKNPAFNVLVPQVAIPFINYTFVNPKPLEKQFVPNGYSYQNVDKSAGYVYVKPEAPITYSTPAPEAKPVAVVYSTPTPIVQQQKISFSTHPDAVTYSTPAPVTQQKVSVSYPEVVTYSTPAPVVQQKVSVSYPEVVTYSTPAPVVQQKVSVTYPEVVTYSTAAPVVQPKVSFAYQDVVRYSTPAPVVVHAAPEVQQKVTVTYPNPVTYSTPAPVIKENVGYSYPKPNVVFEEKPAVIVEGYNYPKPSVAFEEKPVGYNYPKPAVVYEEKPIVGYNYPKPSIAFEEKPVVVEQKGYSYPKPSVVFEEKPVVVEQRGYNYPKPSVVFEERPVVVEQKGYSYPKPSVVFEEKPKPAVIVSTTVTPLPPKPKSYYYQKPVFKGYDYPKPSVVFSEEPVQVPVQEEPVIKKTAYVTGNQYQQKQNLGGSFEYVAPVVASTAVPVVAPKKYSQAADASYAYFNRYNVANSNAGYEQAFYSNAQPAVYVSSTPQPTLYVSSTPKPTFASVIVNAAKLEEGAKVLRVSTSPRPTIQTQSPPISRYEFSSLDEQRQVVETPKTTYLPVQAKIGSSTTPVPARVVESYIAPTQQPPVRLVARPKATMIVKQNDFHPLLSAKLGAQCTCVSNTLKLKKPPPVTVVTTTPEDSESIEIENYRAPESTTNPIQPAPAPTYVVKKRLRVRPTTTLVYEEAPTSRPTDVFLTEKSTNDYSDKELADTVRKGLNLIKAAAKEGAKEALNTPAFDRYGPGGWRSRDETLQGTIDCQRAGLFRHPNQCNKFYACRWDCDKKRFTLHVFNCPVHLTFDNSLGACNWPSQGPACLENTLLPSE